MIKNEKSDKVIKEQSDDQSQTGKALKKKLQVEYPNLWDVSEPADRDAALPLPRNTKSFLIWQKQAEFVTVAVETLESLGFSDLNRNLITDGRG